MGEFKILKREMKCGSCEAKLSDGVILLCQKAFFIKTTISIAETSRIGTDLGIKHMEKARSFGYNIKY